MLYTTFFSSWDKSDQAIYRDLETIDLINLGSFVSLTINIDYSDDKRVEGGF